MALIKEYFDLTNKYKEEYGENSILLMQVGSFFEVYGMLNKNTNQINGSNILDFSRICDLNVVEKNVCVGEKNIVMAGFKDTMIEKHIKKIQEAGFTAVVYTQDQAAKNTTRSLSGIFSPGTYFQEDSTRLNNHITCIWIHFTNNQLFLKGKKVVVGIADIDIYTGKTTIFQFQEAWFNNPTTFDELERFISIYHPSEVILISNLSENETNNIIHYANIQCNLIHKINVNSLNEKEKENNKKEKSIVLQKINNCEKQIYQKEILQKFYQNIDSDVFLQNFYQNDIACQAFCFLLDFVYQHNPYLVNKISEPIFENCHQRLVLANHSLKQLNMIDDSNYTGKYSSVLKMLNICLTPMGKREFSYQLLNPTTNIEFLEREYNIIEHFMNEKQDEKYNERLKKVSEIKDLSKWERQIFLKKISPKSFYYLHKSIGIIQEIHENIQHDSTICEYLFKNHLNSDQILPFCHDLLSFIERNFILDLCKDMDGYQQFEQNFIQSGIDPELDQKIQLIYDSEDQLEAIRFYLSQLIENTEKKSKSANSTKTKISDFVKIHETEKNHFSLLSTSRRCKILEDQLPTSSSVIVLNYISSFDQEKKEYSLKVSKKEFEFHKQSTSNHFISHEQINQLCKTISTIKVEMKDMITRVYYQLVEKMEKYQVHLECMIRYITLIDVAYTKSVIAKQYNYCKPFISKDETKKSFVNVKQLRHCLIEQLQTNEIYVTNDLCLGGEGVDGMLLYGTNAVGKTSLIRALGICVIMAQAGFYVPCSEFIFKPYQSIFTRILGNDNIFKGLSTFAVEMSELRTILRLADENSLILGDELCSGTENTSAISIFVAGIQHLYQSKSSFIFATHLHEIVDYAEITELTTVLLKHMSVVYNKEKDVLVYDRKLKDGPGNNMYGLEVCKSLNLPDNFLEVAYQIRNKYNLDNRSPLSLKTSHYNSKKIMGICERCEKNIGTEVHHLQHQKKANKEGVIMKKDGIFHKNHLANLLTLCEACHHEFHAINVEHKKVKTSNGYSLEEV